MLRRSVSAETQINASAERVWAILTDFAAYSSWNPFVINAEGVAKLGTRLKVRIQPPGKSAMTFKPRVIVCEPKVKFSWLGSIGTRFIFDGEHIYEIFPLEGGNTVRFVQRESFHGILVPLIFASMKDSTLQGFQAFNAALKARAEADL